MPKLNYKTLRQEVVDEIRQRILTGDFQAGERIKENEMAQQLGVSRGPVREALRQLEQEGLIYPVKGKGNFIADSQEVRKASIESYKREMKSLIQKGKAIGVEEEELIYIIRECYKEGMS